MQVSLIIPAHNEAERLAATVEEYGKAFDDAFGHQWELLIVVNGSTDATESVACSIQRRNMRVLVIPERIGKGGAVVAGMQAARGQAVVFADADAATDSASLLSLLAGLHDSDVVIGSRRLPESTILRPQPWLRRVLGHFFAGSVQMLFNLPVRDTQCGAKAMRHAAAQQLAALVSERFWAFDVDLLLCAQSLGFTIVELPVVWQDQTGSRLRIRATALQVLQAFWRMKRRHAHPQMLAALRSVRS